MSIDATPPPTATRGRQWLGLGALIVLALVALGVGVNLVSMPRSCRADEAGAGYCGTPTPGITSPVDGVVISVDSAALGDVKGFSLRPANASATFVFTIGQLENPTEFPVSHLAEHQATSSPVRVFFRSQDGGNVVYRLEDAPGPGAS